MRPSVKAQTSADEREQSHKLQIPSLKEKAPGTKHHADTKSQIPSSRLQRNSKPQIPKAANGRLEPGAWSFFGVWNLEPVFFVGSWDFGFRARALLLLCLSVLGVSLQFSLAH